MKLRLSCCIFIPIVLFYCLFEKFGLLTAQLCPTLIYKDLQCEGVRRCQWVGLFNPFDKAYSYFKISCELSILMLNGLSKQANWDFSLTIIFNQTVFTLLRYIFKLRLVTILIQEVLLITASVKKDTLQLKKYDTD